MQIQPYLFFEGRAGEAIEFYKQALGAEVIMLMRYKDSPAPPPPGTMPPGSEDKIMHAALNVGGATLLMSDGHCSGKPDFHGVSLSLDVDKARVERVFNALAEGGQVRMPLAKAFFAAHFGMLADRFGVPWMVIAQ